MKLSWITIFIFLFVVTACAPPRATTCSKQNLEQRITEVMNAKVAGDWGKVYNYFDKDYRSQIPLSSFINRSRIKFEKYSIKSITVSADQRNAEAQLVLECSSKGFNFTGIKDTQHWVYDQNNWYQKISANSQKELITN